MVEHSFILILSVLPLLSDVFPMLVSVPCICNITLISSDLIFLDFISVVLQSYQIHFNRLQCSISTSKETSSTSTIAETVVTAYQLEVCWDCTIACIILFVRFVIPLFFSYIYASSNLSSV